MTNENKCFFSISLENGFTISGESPKAVKEFLSDLYIALDDCKQTSIKEGYKYFAKKCDIHQRAILNGANTIIQNYKHIKED